MQWGDRNIYQSARKTAGLTQERAAEMLDISVESLRAYETGVRLPPNEAVDRMVIVYGTQVLAYQHIRASADLARELLPEVRELDLPVAAMRLISRIYRFADNHQDRELMKITEDGAIDGGERKRFDEITADLADIIQAALELRCSKQVNPRISDKHW